MQRIVRFVKETMTHRGRGKQSREDKERANRKTREKSEREKENENREKREKELKEIKRRAVWKIEQREEGQRKTDRAIVDRQTSDK